jgi:flavodoxin
MKSLVVYGSRHGNTRKVAETIAGALRKHGAVQLVPAEKALATRLEDTDLVVVGGPTEAHGITEPVARFLEGVAEASLAGKCAAGFDTRLRWPRWLSGSAGAQIVERLAWRGAHVIAPEESFLVSGKLPVLEPGELERAAAWAASLVAKVESKEPVAIGL